MADEGRGELRLVGVDLDERDLLLDAELAEGLLHAALEEIADPLRDLLVPSCSSPGARSRR